jgi:hypothetical protein
VSSTRPLLLNSRQNAEQPGAGVVGNFHVLKLLEHFNLPCWSKDDQGKDFSAPKSSRISITYLIDLKDALGSGVNIFHMDYMDYIIISIDLQPLLSICASSQLQTNPSH